MTNLLKNLFKEVKNIDRKKLKKFAEEMTELVINELKKKQKDIE
jgi:hydrogenase maturation factor HypE